MRLFTYDKNKNYEFNIGVCINQFHIALPFTVSWFPCNVKGVKFHNLDIYFLCFGIHFEFIKWSKNV